MYGKDARYKIIEKLNKQPKDRIYRKISTGVSNDVLATHGPPLSTHLKVWYKYDTRQMRSEMHRGGHRRGPRGISGGTCWLGCGSATDGSQST
jgi:hypothetical protein